MAKSSLPIIYIKSNDKSLIFFALIFLMVGLLLVMPTSTFSQVLGAMFLFPAGIVLLYYIFTPYVSSITLDDTQTLTLQKTAIALLPVKKLKIKIQELTVLDVFDKDKNNKTVDSILHNAENFFLPIKKIGITIKSQSGFSEKIDNFDEEDLKKLLLEIRQILNEIPPITSCRTCHDKGRLNAPTRYIHVDFNNNLCYVCRDEKQRRYTRRSKTNIERYRKRNMAL